MAFICFVIEPLSEEFCPLKPLLDFVGLDYKLLCLFVCLFVFLESAPNALIYLLLTARMFILNRGSKLVFEFAFFSSDLQEMVDVVDHHQLFVKIEKAFPECDEEGCLKIYENVLRCVGNKQYVCCLVLR